jgi:hypothetical protein
LNLTKAADVKGCAVMVIVMSIQASIIIIPAPQVVKKNTVAIAPLLEFIAHKAVV